MRRVVQIVFPVLALGLSLSLTQCGGESTTGSSTTGACSNGICGSGGETSTSGTMTTGGMGGAAATTGGMGGSPTTGASMTTTGGKACSVGADCSSTVCSAGLCKAPACNDVIKDGAETDIDCGGGTCAACALGQGCKVFADCVSVACSAGACVPPTCSDGAKNGNETGKDCGGGCPGCPTGQPCAVIADCASQICTAQICAAPSCNDALKNGAETSIDCGGGACPKCATGMTCSVNADCQSGSCVGAVCTIRLFLSEIRTRGLGGSSDEFVEIYNPGSAPVQLDASWTLTMRSSLSDCLTPPSDKPQLRYTWAGQVIPGHGHFLITGSAYTQAPTGDASFINGGLSDAASIELLHGATVVDAVCFYYDPTNLLPLTSACPGGIPFVCEGTPVSNLPHDGPSPGGTSDVSIERKPGGALGNGTDTDNNVSDFKTFVAPANPQHLQSAPTP